MCISIHIGMKMKVEIQKTDLLAINFPTRLRISDILHQTQRQVSEDGMYLVILEQIKNVYQYRLLR